MKNRYQTICLIYIVTIFLVWSIFCSYIIKDFMQAISITVLFIFISVVSSTSIIRYCIIPIIKNQKMNQLALEEAELLLEKVELERQKSIDNSLKQQISAHFTVNVLSSIKLLIERGETDRAGQMSDGLSYLSRYSNSEEEFIDGMEEFFILQKYITIMEIRFHRKFTTTFYWDDCLDGIFLPRMLIQPLLENAIHHGFQYMTDGGELTISGTFESGDVIIRVSDNGCGMSEESFTTLVDRMNQIDSQKWQVQGNNHIALLNIQRRIHSRYGSYYGLTLESAENQGTTVTLKLPALYN